MSIVCPLGHDGTFVVKNTIRQALGTGVIRINTEGAVLEVIDPGQTRVDLRCDGCKKNFSVIIPGGRRAQPFATETVVDRTVLDETLNTTEPVGVAPEEGEDDEDDDRPNIISSEGTK